MATRTSIAPLPHPARGRVAPPPAVGPAPSAPVSRASESIVEVDAELLELVAEAEPDAGMSSVEEIDAALLCDEDPAGESVVAARLIETATPIPAAPIVAAPIVAAPVVAAPIAAAPIVAAPIVAASIVAAPVVAKPSVAAPIVAAPIAAPAAASSSVPTHAAPTVVARASAVVKPHVHPTRAPKAASSTVASVSSASLIAAVPGRWPWWRYTALSAGLSALVMTLALVGRSDRAEAASSSADVDPVELHYDPALVAQAAMVPVVAAATTASEPPRLLARRVALRGQRNLAAGLPRLARAAFEEALQLDPRNRAALAGLGRLEFEAGRFTAAIEHLELAVQLEPRDRELRSMLAQAHEAKGHSRSAARHARLAGSP